MVQTAAVVADVRHVHHHVAGQLALVRDGPVLEPRQRQPIFRHRNGRRPQADRRVDERRLLNRARREALIEQKRRLDAVRRVRRQRVLLESEGRLPDELIERDVRVVDAVAAAERAPVVDAIGGADARPPGVLRRVLERPRSRPALDRRPAKIIAPGWLPAPGFGVFGSNVEY